MNPDSYAEDIRNLENIHRAKLAQIVELQHELRMAQQTHSRLSMESVQEHNETIDEHRVELERRNNKEIEVLTIKKQRELDFAIAECDAIASERTIMNINDVEAEVLRELDNAWEQIRPILVNRLQQQQDLELGVSRATHDKMYREFVRKLAAEEEEMLEAAHEEKVSSSRKRASGGVFGWLSPSKKGRVDSEDEAE